MDELIEIGMLIDFYGQMLTQRQLEILDLYYNSDYSLGEIAEELSISRQGVHDNIKRGKAALYEYENKLGLVKRFRAQKNRLQKLVEKFESIDILVLSDTNKEALLEIKGELVNLTEEI